MTRSSQQEERNDRLVKLLPAIHNQTRHLAIRYHNLDDVVTELDVVGEACRFFLERAEANPTFLDQPDEEIIYRCTLDGWNAARSQQSRDWQVSLEEVAQTTDNGQRVEILATDAYKPEEAVIAAELVEEVQEAIADLKANVRETSRDTYLTIVRGLMEGLKPTKVMDGLGIQRQNWTWYRKKLQCTFASMALT